MKAQSKQRKLVAVEGKLRYEFVYGMSYLQGNSLPHFSVTGSSWKGEREESGGMLHTDFARFYPRMKYLLKWHLADQSGTPMHYKANSVYWWQFFAGTGRWFDSTKPFGGASTDPYEAFKATVVFGALEDDDAFMKRAEAAAKERDQAKLVSLLQARLPRLQEAFRRDMSLAGVEFIEMSPRPKGETWP